MGLADSKSKDDHKNVWVVKEQNSLTSAHLQQN
jgi:hypothetical protein